MPKVSDVIYYKAGMSLGLGKPVSVTPFEKLDFPAQEHRRCFQGVIWKIVSKNFRRTSVYCKKTGLEKFAPWRQNCYL